MQWSKKLDDGKNLHNFQLLIKGVFLMLESLKGFYLKAKLSLLFPRAQIQASSSNSVQEIKDKPGVEQ